MKLHEIIERGRNKYYTRVDETHTITKYKIFLDLDGVMADFASALSKILEEPYSDTRYHIDKAYKKHVWDTIKKHEKLGVELWANLDLMSGAKSLWSFLKPYHPEILTASGSSLAEQVKRQKQQWIRKHFGNVPTHIVVNGADKKQYAANNHILVDDKPQNIAAWESAGGTGILHTSMHDTMTRLKEILR